MGQELCLSNNPTGSGWRERSFRLMQPGHSAPPGDPDQPRHTTVTYCPSNGYVNDGVGMCPGMMVAR
jgi:hypothetical protein